MEFGLKWAHMARYELILRLEGALWLTIISGPLLTQKGAIKDPQNPKKVLKSVPNQPRPDPGTTQGQTSQAKFGKSGDLEIQKFGIHKMKTVKIIKIQIRSTQNVGKVWISRKTNPPDPILGHPRQFFPWIEKNGNKYKNCLFSLVGQWALFTRFGGGGEM